MTKNTKKELKKYYKQIRRELTCSFNIKNAFMHDLKNIINLMDINSPETTIDDIIETYGSPSEISKSFYEQNLDNLKNKAKFYTIAEIGMCLLLVATIAVMIVLIIHFCGDVNIVGPKSF